MSALQTLREILSMPGDNPAFVFTSIELVRPGFGFSNMSAKAGEELTFRLGYEGNPPERISGHLFDEGTGHLVSRLKKSPIHSESGSLLCGFTLPTAMTAQRVCLVIEGQRAGSDPGGCEMSFSIANLNGGHAPRSCTGLNRSPAGNIR